MEESTSKTEGTVLLKFFFIVGRRPFQSRLEIMKKNPCMFIDLLSYSV